MTTDKSAVLQLLPDLREVAFVGGKVERSADALEVVDLRLYFGRQSRQRFIRALEFRIPVKILLRVLHRRERGVQRHADLLAGVVVVELTGSGPGRDRITVCVEKLAVDPVLVPLLGIPDLFHLQVVLVDVALEDRLDDAAQIRGLLAGAGHLVLLRVESLEELRHGAEPDLGIFVGEVGIDTHGNGAVADGRAAAAALVRGVIDAGRKASVPHIPHETAERVPQGGAVLPGHRRRAPVVGERGAVAQLLGHLRGKAGVRVHEEPGGRHLLTAQEGVEALRGLRQRVLLVPGIRDKIAPPRQHFPHGADEGGDVLDAVYDLFAALGCRSYCACRSACASIILFTLVIQTSA